MDGQRTSQRRRLIVILPCLLLCVGPAVGPPGLAQGSDDKAADPEATAALRPARLAPENRGDPADSREAFRSSPVVFIENVGQFDPTARFQMRGGAGTMWLAADAIWISLLEAPAGPLNGLTRGSGSGS